MKNRKLMCDFQKSGPQGEPLYENPSEDGIIIIVKTFCSSR